MSGKARHHFSQIKIGENGGNPLLVKQASMLFLHNYRYGTKSMLTTDSLSQLVNDLLDDTIEPTYKAVMTYACKPLVGHRPKKWVVSQATYWKFCG